MTTATAFEIRRKADSGAARPAWSAGRGAIGAALFLLIAFILLAAGAAAGAPTAPGVPVEAKAFVLDPSIGQARA